MIALRRIEHINFTRLDCIWLANVMLVALGLFNDDTCPSGHISRPTHVNVSQELLSFSKKLSYTGKCVSELLSFSKQLLKSDHIVDVWGLVEVNELHHIR